MQTVTFQSYFDLLFAWTRRTILGRYKQSALGILWAIIQPVAQVLIYTIIFTQIVPIDTDGIPYPVFSFVAMAPWLLFSAGMSDMVASMVINMNLVSKIYFPREILPFAVLIARVLDFAISLIIVAVLLIVYQLPFFIQGWLFIPVLVLIQLLFTAGLGLIGASLNVFYRDSQYIIGLILQIWMYASPIIYPVSKVPEQYQTLYFLNPMAGILQAYRQILLEGVFPGQTLMMAAGVSIVVFIAGLWFFKRTEFQFADVV
jgi:lipopolysaccharide transport system permease protein